MYLLPNIPPSSFDCTGGLYTKTVDGLYHLFPTECMSDMPKVAWDIHTESHHWVSPDGVTNWTQHELTFNSSAKQDGNR
jgi:hypothetical protein